jgi:NADH:ubiquinone oxidoreductase subunit F (NADH-binding)
MGFERHLDVWGAMPSDRAGLLDALEASGLAGHGGAWFPVAAKWRSVGGARRRPVVVANGAESEPASGKDALLLARLPHLVLDGLSLAARTLDATRAVLYAPAHLVSMVEPAIRARRRLGIDPVPIEVARAADRFVAGQETAVVSALNGGPPIPSFAGITPVRSRGVAGRPTLVQNVETLAHVALVARFGATWFRSLGTASAPGTMLVTVSGRWPGRRLLEAPLGVPVGSILGLAPHETDGFWGVLLGGYGGGWLSTRTALDLPLTEEAARQHGTSLGAGVMLLLPSSTCPLAESARIVRYLQQQSAHQCGPCTNGLWELAELCDRLATRPAALRRGVGPLLDRCDLVQGRGACRHPDGAARLVRSAVEVFGDHVDQHLRAGPCRHVGAPSALPGIGAIPLAHPAGPP